MAAAACNWRIRSIEWQWQWQRILF